MTWWFLSQKIVKFGIYEVHSIHHIPQICVLYPLNADLIMSDSELPPPLQNNNNNNNKKNDLQIK